MIQFHLSMTNTHLSDKMKISLISYKIIESVCHLCLSVRDFDFKTTCIALQVKEGRASEFSCFKNTHTACSTKFSRTLYLIIIE